MLEGAASMKDKSIAELEAFAREARAVALRFLEDAGYTKIRPDYDHHLWQAAQNAAYVGEAIILRFKARRGPGAPNAPDRSGAERLFVRVRLTGPTHKTLRASLVQPPADSSNS